MCASDVYEETLLTLCPVHGTLTLPNLRHLLPCPLQNGSSSTPSYNQSSTFSSSAEPESEAIR